MNGTKTYRALHFFPYVYQFNLRVHELSIFKRKRHSLNYAWKSVYSWNPTIDEKFGIFCSYAPRSCNLTSKSQPGETFWYRVQKMIGDVIKAFICIRYKLWWWNIDYKGCGWVRSWKMFWVDEVVAFLEWQWIPIYNFLLWVFEAVTNCVGCSLSRVLLLGVISLFGSS